MAQDLRKMFKEDREKRKHSLAEGHEARFHERLKKELPQKKTASFQWLKIAAAILVLVSVGFYGVKKYKANELMKTTIVERETDASTNKEISLGDLSPDLKKIENYYIANINLELSKLEVSKENKTLVSSFMDQLANLNNEYEKLISELNQMGPNDQTITALIQNLQLRLQLLQRLKKKLNELKTSKNEQIKTNTI